MCENCVKQNIIEPVGKQPRSSQLNESENKLYFHSITQNSICCCLPLTLAGSLLSINAFLKVDISLQNDRHKR